jgi:hypothetical protein
MAPVPFLGGQMVPTFAVPPDGSSVGWWAEGPQIDAPGMAIMLGIKQVGGGYAAFNRLDDLHPGDQVTVTDATGSARADFRITRVVPDILKNDPEALRREKVLLRRLVQCLHCSERFRERFRFPAAPRETGQAERPGLFCVVTTVVARCN